MLLSAVLQTLTERGPNPVSFKASPSADFLADGRLIRSAPGWWVTYACALEITSHTVEDDGHFEEVVSLSFSPPPKSKDVHNGEPWVWELTYGAHADRRLVLRDHATYRDPLRHLLQYHAIGRCREALLERAAARLGHQLGDRTSIGAAVAAVIAAVFGKSNASSASMEVQPMWRPDDESTLVDVVETGERVDVSAALAPAPATSSPSPFAWAVQTAALSSELAAFRVLDETPRSNPSSSRPPAPALADEVPSSLATAEAFASNYIMQPASGGGVFPMVQLVEEGALGQRSQSSLEDQIDSLRARMPHRSTDTLREMVRQQGPQPER